MSALTGTVALITGASSGIGAATARALAAEGAAVALVARRADRLDALAAEITGAAGRALAIVADITDRGEADASVARTVDELGRLDILVNNAGLMLVGPIEEAPIDEWDRMIDLNLTAALSMTKAALPHLLAAAESDPRRVADVVNISSTAGRQVKRGSGVYNLTKHGLGAFSESFRQEFSARYVRMALIEPERSTPSCATTSATACARATSNAPARSTRCRRATSPRRSATSSPARAGRRSTKC